MKINTRKVFNNVLIAFCLLLLAGSNVLAAEHKEETGKSFLDQQVDKMNPIIRPYAQVIADNIVAIFLFFGGVFLLYDGLQASRKKKKGRTAEAAEYKNNTIETAKELGLALLLFAVFIAVPKSDLINLV